MLKKHRKMIAAKSFEFLALGRNSTLDSRVDRSPTEDSAVTDLDYSDGSDSPPDYEEVADAQEMVFNIHNDTLYSKVSARRHF